MKLNSLAFRLFAASALWTLLVLPLAGYLLQSNYRQDVETIFDLRLDTAWWALVNLSVSPGATAPSEPAATAFGDPSYNVRFSGWYWQIAVEGDNPAGAKVLISPSLQGEELTFPKTGVSSSPGSSYASADGVGPQGESIRMFSKVITFGDGPAARHYRYIVTGNLTEADVTLRRFRSTLTLVLSLLGAGLVFATLFQVRYGLQPLRAIEKGLGDIRSGKAMRLEGELPTEIVPLQRELNALITSNQEVIERARTHVGNLAHALKTPLSVLTNEARGDTSPLGRKVTEQTNIMRDQVQHHLDRARMVARTSTLGSVTEVKPVVDALVRVLGRIHAERGLQLTSICDERLNFQGEKQDLEEMLGNLADNACKWASTSVEVKATRLTAKRGAPDVLLLQVDDDGPGLNDTERVEARQRGKRLDETKPGSGLGLSIVTELAGLYHGKFELERSPRGGLQARLLLPVA
jgi:signal transduction histidine kinase